MAEQIIQQNALPVNPDLLLSSIDNNRIVMIGDDTHGSTELYQFRAEMSKHLILKKGFTIIGIEWDWIDVGRINQYILGSYNNLKAWDILNSITRFPTFMYKNHPFEEFIEWLKQYNQTAVNKITVYGLDIYGIIATIKYLYENLPNQRNLIQKIYDVWKNFNPNEYNYGSSGQSVQYEVEQLQFTGDFFLDQAILQIKEAEQYYRIKSQDENDGWNLRDIHMTRVISDLLYATKGKIICWLHNTHSGNFDFVSEVHEKGQINVASILKQSFGLHVYSIGLLTYTGTVTASNRWFGPTIQFNLNPAIKGSFEYLLHESMNNDFMLILRNGDQRLLQLLSIPRYERFIGGAYNPDNEVNDHYVHAQLYPQFDAIVFFNYSHSF